MPAALYSSLLAVVAAEPASQPISIQTALLVILGIGLLFAVKSLAKLHRRVDTLAATASSKGPQPAAATTGTIPPEILAVITAAVFETLGSDLRIVSISSAQQGNSNWSQEGRRQIFGSRKVR